ncbi:TrbC/VirB2 family protein [Stenotrophomonas maltophilia]|uniref:TrbC/VirB2 family protein n=1 Tax=Stenotrophomonas maltophilia TaxID=40324 RepID=UPI00244B068C|nr:TrbC/VirB2 family protein [Stenotrophomonas maltophilia]MDH0074146.1 TrbC/VirB2 family protein [Stenotrophomonas maltophilia]MDH0333606.1 TrbC/VirB2 family protein [Stenotrophomonas maltophilia]
MKNERKTSLQLLVLLALALVCSSAYAGEPMPWDSGLKKLADAMTGTTAMYISLLAFAGCMYQLIWGAEMTEFTKRLVTVVASGSGLVGAASLAKNLLGVQVTGAVVGGVADASSSVEVMIEWVRYLLQSGVI